MKCILILACLAVFVAYAQAQRFCPGSVYRDQTNCVGGQVNGNRRRRHCRQNGNDFMWYYNERDRACRPMSYRGCGGNSNRYCSQEICEQRCIPPRGTRPTGTRPTRTMRPSRTTRPTRSTRPTRTTRPTRSPPPSAPTPAELETTGAPEAAATNSGAARS